MQLIDGYNGGVAHISASMIRDHNISLYGENDCVLSVGNQFAYEIVNNNTIRINDGMAIIGGARAIIEYGQQETVTIENGMSGYKRNDLIVIEYSKDIETLKEKTELKVIKGELGTSGVDPVVVDGDIRTGATQRQMPLYRVVIDGLSISRIDTLWNPASVGLVEYSIVDGWTVEKYADGRAICYTLSVVTYSGLSMAANGYSYASEVISQSLPAGLFIDKNYTCNPQEQTDGRMAKVVRMDTSTRDTFHFKIHSSHSSTTVANIRFEIKGRWK